MQARVSLEQEMVVAVSIAIAKGKMEDILYPLIHWGYEPSNYSVVYRIGGWRLVSIICRITHPDVIKSCYPMFLDYTIYTSPMLPEWGLQVNATRWQHRTERTLLTHLEELRRTPND